MTDQERAERLEMMELRVQVMDDRLARMEAILERELKRLGLL